MKKKAYQLRQEKAALLDTYKALHDQIESEKRAETADETKRFSELRTQIDALNQPIADAEAHEATLRSVTGTPVETGTSNAGEVREIRNYSFTKFLREITPTVSGGTGLTGLEKEMHEEAVKEANQRGVTLKGNGISEKVLWNAGTKRDATVTVAPQPQSGAILVQTDVMPLIEILRQKLVTEALGATFMRGLQGNVRIPKGLTEAQATWKTEIAALDKSELTFGAVELSPNRLGTYAVASKQLLIQSSVDVERIIRNSLAYAIAKAVDIAAINGSGVAPEPLGILNRNDVNSVTLGTNGAAPTREMLIAMESEIQYDDADMNMMKYLTNPRVIAKLKNTKLDAGSGLFVLDNSRQANGYDVVTSNIVPSNITKGTSGATLSAAIFGYWPALMIGQWGGLDIMTDPYTLALNSEIRIIADSFWDIDVTRGEHFTIVKDIVTV